MQQHSLTSEHYRLRKQVTVDFSCLMPSKVLRRKVVYEIIPLSPFPCYNYMPFTFCASFPPPIVLMRGRDLRMRPTPLLSRPPPEASRRDPEMKTSIDEEAVRWGDVDGPAVGSVGQIPADPSCFMAHSKDSSPEGPRNGSTHGDPESVDLRDGKRMGTHGSACLMCRGQTRMQ